ncbi:hypothetical protein F2P79_018600 [Pimephales promelas]|nr:hypothetical protein F2P79_018600 [Pimephales promelas]
MAVAGFDRSRQGEVCSDKRETGRLERETAKLIEGNFPSSGSHTQAMHGERDTQPWYITSAQLNFRDPDESQGLTLAPDSRFHWLGTVAIDLSAIGRSGQARLSLFVLIWSSQPIKEKSERDAKLGFCGAVRFPPLRVKDLSLYLCYEAEDLSTDWLNERTLLSTADTGSESKKAGQRVKHHLAHSRTASASILLNSFLYQPVHTGSCHLLHPSPHRCHSYPSRADATIWTLSMLTTGAETQTTARATIDKRLQSAA